jgi:hypothetical protein
MAKSHPRSDRRPDLGNIPFRPIRANLRAPRQVQPAERRDLRARQALVRRVHGEFLEMPGLTLSIAQAARLFSLPPAVCARVFGELLNSQLLRRTADGRYVLLRRHS